MSKATTLTVPIEVTGHRVLVRLIGSGSSWRWTATDGWSRTWGGREFGCELDALANARDYYQCREPEDWDAPAQPSDDELCELLQASIDRVQDEAAQ